MPGIETKKKTRYKSLKFLGFPNYAVGDNGVVWSKSKKWRKVYKWRKLKPDEMTNRGGHLRVVLCSKGIKRSLFVHQIVLLAFVGACPEGMQARHFPDRNPKNNHLTNLQWATLKTNQKDRIYHNTDLRGTKSPNSKLNDCQVSEIRDLYESKIYSVKELSNIFNLSESCIYGVVSYRTYQTKVVEIDAEDPGNAKPREIQLLRKEFLE